MFEYLTKHGVVDVGKVRGGNVFGSLEGAILIPEENQKDVNHINVAVYSIAKFLHKEAPSVKAYKSYEDNFDKSLTDPSDEDSTELGEVPHEVSKGTLQPGYNYGPYFANYVLEQKQRED